MGKINISGSNIYSIEEEINFKKMTEGILKTDKSPKKPRLKECPFCKSSNLSVSPNWVFCRKCTATGPVGETRIEGCELWNQRTQKVTLN
jgi:DnaJ-class molecular chaperone